MTLRRLLAVGAVLAVAAVVTYLVVIAQQAGGPDHRPDDRAAAEVRLRTFPTRTVRITDASGHTHLRCLWAALTEPQQRRGLMEVRDRTLQGRDGMVFAFGEPEQSGFWMRNTPVPLSIAYFDRRGRVVSTTDMAPCADSPSCPSYPPTGPYTVALEVPHGRLANLGVGRGSQLRVGGRCSATPH